MSEDGDYEYYLDRAVACRRLAAIAATPAVGVLHETFATLYDRAAADMIAASIHRSDRSDMHGGPTMTIKN